MLSGFRSIFFSVDSRPACAGLDFLVTQSGFVVLEHGAFEPPQSVVLVFVVRFKFHNAPIQCDDCCDQPNADPNRSD